MLHKTLTKLVQSDSNSFILALLDDISHLEFCHHGFSYFAQKKFTHSFWLNLMMAAILNSAILDSDTAILDSDTLVSSLRFTQKHSHTILTLTQTNSIWLKLIHSHSTWWLQPSWILPSWIQPFCTKKKLHLFIVTQLDDCSHLEICHLGFSHFAQKELHSFILTQLDDISHLEFCHHGFNYFAPKKNFTHSFWLNLMIAAMLKSAILDSAICTKKLHSFILTQLDDGSHLEFCHLGFRHCHLGFRHLVIFSQIHSKTLFLHSELTQTNSIWLT